MKNGFLRVAAAVPPVSVADCKANVSGIVRMCDDLNARAVRLAVFPELCLSGYTCGDLLHNSTLLDGAFEAVHAVASASERWGMTVVVGLPLLMRGAVRNCAAVVASGHIHAVVPKTYLPDYNEFYERRWFAPGVNDTIFTVDGVGVAIDICEDLWAPVPPSTHAALSGAEVIVNLSASNDIIGKYDYLTSLIREQSARCIAAYVYAGAGFGESSTDLVFDGKAIIAENGTILGASERWRMEPSVTVADVDVEALRRDRLHMTTFGECAAREGRDYSRVDATPVLPAPCDGEEALMRRVAPRPFVPESDDRIDERCSEIISIQVAGLAKRLAFTRCKCTVVGISGGLDSTLALMVACRTFDRMGLDRAGIVGVTMPGFGTTGRTRSNAIDLMTSLGVTVMEVPIGKAVEQHFADIGHNSQVHDVTYENSQARERTQILMDIANSRGGMVLGTGDLSELALGWATYNGDHMSMYGVNAGVPKTLVRYLVNWFAMRAGDGVTRNALLDIIATPISPELIPADADGNITQKTEDLVGPYELHDFFLYYMLRYGFSPRRIYLLALKAFENTADYTPAVIKHWLTTFVRRFFAQQFKRSCLPDGPKVGSVCLSPRGDWRMPSDASAAMWLAEAEAL